MEEKEVATQRSEGMQMSTQEIVADRHAQCKRAARECDDEVAEALRKWVSQEGRMLARVIKANVPRLKIEAARDLEPELARLIETSRQNLNVCRDQLTVDMKRLEQSLKKKNSIKLQEEVGKMNEDVKGVTFAVREEQHYSFSALLAELEHEIEAIRLQFREEATSDQVSFEEKQIAFRERLFAVANTKAQEEYLHSSMLDAEVEIANHQKKQDDLAEAKSVELERQVPSPLRPRTYTL